MPDGPLPDGMYDAFIVDANRDGPTIHVELAIIAGEHKGEVVSVTTTGVDRDEVDLMGLPATVTVREGAPDLTIEG